ncbi:hypothetical protein [Tateyamaria sp. ANG-S1]|uniref:hypothetical protein n=1 Tax=Tateyamaria sp. ANG-S1 TaxID=1577905 RepID=UPI00057EADD2|nr:hypothetical protein [Tateyamaria sp. ANG-S1]KIC44887.1 hypothetical protein RA29_21170 [Tateyamaria sp. ANG-S1]
MMARSSPEQARHMVQYLCGMFVLLACAVMTALVLSPEEEVAAPPTACSATALYPVERLAVRGDVGAMAYVAARFAEDGCDVQARAYLELAAEAGHAEARQVLDVAEAEERAASVSSCAALLAMMMPGVDDAHLVPGACSRP